MVLTFKEYSSGYAGRTKENAKADVTLAIAKDYYTPGERLTKRVVNELGGLYIALPLHNIAVHSTAAYMDVDIAPQMLNSIVDRIANLKKPQISLNIAGNGIYSLDVGQPFLDSIILSVMSIIVNKLNKKGISIILIRSGGQTGIDEAGLKAAVKLNIPAFCLAPKCWTFRDINGKDINNEQLFKERFQ